MQHNCERHTFEQAEGVCKSCLGSFCHDCLIFPWGPKKEPLCKPCAITAGGIRSTARRPRRVFDEQVAAGGHGKGKSGGLLRRFHAGHEEGDIVPETPEEVIEREAAEARELLDAQRLPTETEEEPEIDATPTPNIAPPGAVHEGRELNHRPMPDTVSGGLDLHDADDASAGRVDATVGDDTPAWAQPEAAGLQPEAEPRADAPDDTPAWARPEAAGAAAVASAPVIEAVPPPMEAVPEPVFVPASPAPDPPVADAHLSETPLHRTADGQELFTVPLQPANEPAAPTPVEPKTAPVTNGHPDDTAELLRRIAELRGR